MLEPLTSDTQTLGVGSVGDADPTESGMIDEFWINEGKKLFMQRKIAADCCMHSSWENYFASRGAQLCEADGGGERVEICSSVA